MITAIVEPQLDGKCFVKFQIPDHGKFKYITSFAENTEDVYRQLYFRIRKYICTTLIAWLLQRQHAINLNPESHLYVDRMAAVQELLIKLDYYKASSCRHLGNVINKHNDQFLLLAPGKKSHHYRHFETTIKPILDFCSKNHN
ncbi:MAG: hypothetical protein H7Y13_12040 [Sphingobacteriaceae bacterium]|nr:hypothetical protein [Sphingobacteriaceae bacterium]